MKNLYSTEAATGKSQMYLFKNTNKLIIIKIYQLTHICFGRKLSFHFERNSRQPVTNYCCQLSGFIDKLHTGGIYGHRFWPTLSR